MVPDPDTELWPQVVVNIWPFVGSPTRGAFRTGWMGIDAAATVWVCTGADPGSTVGAAVLYLMTATPA